MKKFELLTAGSLMACLLATPAYAQDEAPMPIEDDSQDAVITVTAQLREQLETEVPFALTAYDENFLERTGAKEFEDLSRFVPGFAVQNQSPNNPAISMRGITTDSGASFVAPRVSIYQDGVAIAKPRGAYVELFDLERVEIAKGPQSTLYGRGALIGALNIVQAKPEIGEDYGMVRVGFGNFNALTGDGMANWSLGDNVAMRFAARHKSREGYVENLSGGRDFQGVDTTALRGSFRFEADDDTTIDIIANYQSDTPSATAFKSLTWQQTNPATGEVLAGTGIEDGAWLDLGDGFENNRRAGLDRDVWGATILAETPLSEHLTLNSISAYRTFDAYELFDVDGIGLPVISAAEDADGDQFSQEFRLSFDDGGPLTAFGGVSIFTESGSQRTPVQFDERMALARLAGALNGGPFAVAPNVPAPAGLFDNTMFTAALLQGVAGSFGYALDPALAAGLAANLKPDHRETETNQTDTTAFDIFADLAYDVSPALEIGGGVRLTKEKTTVSASAATLNGRSILGGFLGALTLPDPLRTTLLGALTVPGAATIQEQPAYPVPNFGITFQPTALDAELLSQDTDDFGVTWRAFARYTLGENTSLYGNYARGRRPEVLSVRSPAVPGGAPIFEKVEAETVDSFELGLKAAPTRALYVDVAGFFYMYDNFQTIEQVGTTFVTTNAGEAESYGVETQLRYKPSDFMQLFATYAYNHSRFKSGVRDGNRFRLSPDHSASIGATFETEIGGRGGSQGRIDFTPTLTYQSKVFFDDDNDRTDLQLPPNALVPDLIVDEFQDGYALVSARLGYTAPTNHWRVEAFIDNAFDEKYIKDAGNTGDGLGLPTFIPGTPRTMGLSVSAFF